MRYCGLTVVPDYGLNRIFQDLTFHVGAIVSQCVSVYKAKQRQNITLYFELALHEVVSESIPRASTMFFVVETSSLLIDQCTELLHRRVLEEQKVSDIGKLVVSFKDDMNREGYSHVRYTLPHIKKEKLVQKRVSKTYIHAELWKEFCGY